MELLGETLVQDYTTRKRILPSKGIIRCPKCGKIGLMKETKLGIHVTHQIYLNHFLGNHRHESCIIPHSQWEKFGFSPKEN